MTFQALTAWFLQKDFHRNEIWRFIFRWYSNHEVVHDEDPVSFWSVTVNTGSADKMLRLKAGKFSKMFPPPPKKKKKEKKKKKQKQEKQKRLQL